MGKLHRAALTLCCASHKPSMPSLRASSRNQSNQPLGVVRVKCARGATSLSDELTGCVLRGDKSGRGSPFLIPNNLAETLPIESRRARNSAVRAHAVRGQPAAGFAAAFAARCTARLRSAAVPMQTLLALNDPSSVHAESERATAASSRLSRADAWCPRSLPRHASGPRAAVGDLRRRH